MVAPLVGITVRAVAAYAKKYGKRKASEEVSKNLSKEGIFGKHANSTKRDIMNSDQVKEAIKDFDVSKIFNKAKGNKEIKTIEDAESLVKKILPTSNNIRGGAKYFLKDKRQGEFFLKREIAKKLEQKKKPDGRIGRKKFIR
tara:strand:- start:49 stop:474 length:426 start_codon:yes stop_codon:yes gene_type:complete